MESVLTPVIKHTSDHTWFLLKTHQGSLLPEDRGELPYPGLKTLLVGTLPMAAGLIFPPAVIWLCVDMEQAT